MLVYSIWILTATKFVQIGIPALDFLPSYTKTGFASLYIYSKALLTRMPMTFTLGYLNSFLGPLKILPIAQEKKIFREIV